MDRVHKTLGNNLRYLRLAAGYNLTQAHIRYAIDGVYDRKDTVRRMELGEVTIQLVVLCRFARFWGVSAADLIGVDLEARDKAAGVWKEPVQPKRKEYVRKKKLGEW